MGPESRTEEETRISLKTKDDSSNSEDPLVSVVIPAFNEERNIGSVLRRTHRALQRVNVPYEVIVVNDGSDDLTA